MKDHGWAKVENNQEEGGHFLVGYRGVIYHVQGDFQVFVHTKPFDAVGCGASFALGAMSVTDGKDPEHRIRLALSVAESLSAGVRGPFTVVSTKKAEPTTG